MAEQDGKTPRLMPISQDGIPGALSRAERYRFLNEPWQAESICRDVIAIEPANQTALILLVLSLTDQFERIDTREARQVAAQLEDEYNRAYYAGIVNERNAIAVFRQNPDYRSRRQVYTLIQTAMEFYRQAQAIQPPANDDSVLRWNACVRFLERTWGLQ
jgi:hypothetical protein